MATELFELEMYGEGIERRFRQMRPEVAAMPWGTFDVSRLSPAAIDAGRKRWTEAAFQEHRTGVACAMALRAMMEARAPVDLVAFACRFPLDEMVHVELCARMAMELGGATALRHDPDRMLVEADPSWPPIERACALVTRFFCVGEAMSIPLLRATWHAAVQPLPKAILGRIVKDEAAHGAFGFAFLDWALGKLDAPAIARIGAEADRAISFLTRGWRTLAETSADNPDASGDTLGWMRSKAYFSLAAASLETKVRAPLRDRGVPLTV